MNNRNMSISILRHFQNSMDSSFLLLLLAVICYAALLLHRAWYKPTPPLPPGPAGLPLVGNLPFLGPNLHAYFAGLARAYGPVVGLRLGTKLGVVVSSPSAAREILMDQDTIFANRDITAAARVITYGGEKDIVWTPNGPTWRMLRRVCVHEHLSPLSLGATMALRHREVRASMKHLRARASTPVEVGTEMFLTLMNAVTSALWGGMLEEDDEREAVGRNFRHLVAEISELLGRPNVSDFFPALALFDLQGIERDSGACMRRFDEIFESIIAKRKKVSTSEEVADFLGIMLRMEKEGGNIKPPFTMANVKALLMDMVVGGTATTSNTVEWALAEMLQKPHILKRAQEEVDRVVGMGKVVEESDVPHLRYLGLVVKETLRLHPALPLLIPHCPSATSVVGGYTVPAGSRVFINVWAIQRDPSLWEDPLDFKPERFLNAAADANKNWDFSGKDFSYFPFGSGRRICPGIPMAERMLTYLLASLVHSFDWKLPEGSQMDMKEKFGVALKKAEPLIVVPTPRLTHPEQYS